MLGMTALWQATVAFEAALTAGADAASPLASFRHELASTRAALAGLLADAELNEG